MEGTGQGQERPGAADFAVALAGLLGSGGGWELRRLRCEDFTDTIELGFVRCGSDLHVDVRVAPPGIDVPGAVSGRHGQTSWMAPPDLSPDLAAEVRQLALGAAELVEVAADGGGGGRLRDALYVATAHLPDPAAAGLTASVRGALREVERFREETRRSVGESERRPGEGPDLYPAGLAGRQTSGRTILTVKADCQQHCEFCAIKEQYDPTDGGAPELARLKLMLRLDRGRKDCFVLNGNDPLAFSGLFELLEEARRLEYPAAEVYSPCTLLADPDFCDRLLAALPPVRHFHVPLYSLHASHHDAVVGRAGAHSLALKGLDELRRRLEPGQITITSVYLRDNLADLPDLWRFARERGHPFFSTMPYPSQDTRDDRIARHSPRQTEVAAMMLPLFRDEPAMLGTGLFGVSPCVVFDAARQHQVGVDPWLESTRRHPSLNSVAVAPRRPCPEAAGCSLASICPGEHFEAYVAQFGTDEFRAVTLADLEASGAVWREEGKA